METRGEQFRASVEHDFEDVDDPVTAALVDQLVRLLNEAEEIERTITADGPTIEGSRGQTQAHPLYTVLHKNRELFAKLSGALFPDPSDETTSDKAKRAARERWAKAKEPRS